METKQDTREISLNGDQTGHKGDIFKRVTKQGHKGDIFKGRPSSFEKHL